MAGKFHIYKDRRHGESYRTKAGAREGCAAVQRAADGAEIVEGD